MKTALLAFLAFLAGVVAGWLCAVAIYIAATNWFGYFDRDGGAAMGTIFMLGPTAGLLFGIAAAIAVVRRRRGA